MPVQEDYRVALDAFQGPLDLLLYLIRRAEVDVVDIPIAKITDQYLAFLRQVEAVDVEVAGDFLVMAATLIEIKSRTIMPPEQTANAGDGESGSDAPPVDPREQLVQQLLAYQRIRVASETLEARRFEFTQRRPLRPGRRTADELGEQRDLELEDAHPMDLADAYERIVTSIDLTRLGDHVVEFDDTPIKLHEEDLLDRLGHADAGRIALQSAFAGRTPMQRAGLFIATLELTRQRRITVEQDDIDADIAIVLRGDDEEVLHIESDGLDHAPEEPADG